MFLKSLRLHVVGVLALAGWMHSANAQDRVPAGTYRFWMCDSSCRLADTTEVTATGWVVLEATAFELDSADQALFQWYPMLRHVGGPGGCFVYEHGGDTHVDLLNWTKNAKLHFGMNLTHHVGIVVDAVVDSLGFEGIARWVDSFEVVVTAGESTTRRDTVVARRTGLPDRSRCLEVARRRFHD